MALLHVLVLPALIMAKPLVPKAMLGSWSGSPTTSALGPRAGGPNFLLFTEGADRAPFRIMPSDVDNEMKLCWIQPRLPSHKANCTGCDCAQLTMRVDGDVLTSVFLQSPPTVHMNITLRRTGPPPLASAVIDGWNCEFSAHTGRVIPNKSIEPATDWYRLAHLGARILAPASPPTSHLRASGPTENCVVLNAVNDVRLAYVADKLPCMPCDVTFSVSAPLSNPSYIAIGFKENYAAYYDYDEHPRDIPNYWGMATSDDNATELSGHIVAGYMSGTGESCVRHLRADAYVGSVVDVAADGLVRNVSVTTAEGRTTLTFTASIHAGKTRNEIAWYTDQLFGLQRVQWATGLVGDDGTCTAPLQYHFGARAAANFAFPGFGSPCTKTEAMLKTDFSVTV